MARIRSIHPGLFTDEAFVSVSDAAQIFYIGLLTEADDQGVFEWKPVTLKMRLRPASLSPVDGLLVELETAQRIRRYEIGGRQYGAMRNFRKFQRPKSPNALHPTTDDIRIYVGLSPPISEMQSVDLAVIPPNGEKSPQMEDGGGRREEITDPNGSDTAACAFEGRLIRLNSRDLEAWQKTYHSIPDLQAELRTLDAYYDAELTGKERTRWFVRCSSALDKKHQAAVAAAAKNGAKGGYVPMHPGAGG